MPRMKNTPEERREKKKILERKRMDKIRADPDLYAQWLVKSRESYQRKKLRGKIVPISALTKRQQKLKRQKSRESSNKYNEKKRLAKLNSSLTNNPVLPEEYTENLNPSPTPTSLNQDVRRPARSAILSEITLNSSVSISKAALDGNPNNRRVTRSKARSQVCSENENAVVAGNGNESVAPYLLSPPRSPSILNSSEFHNIGLSVPTHTSSRSSSIAPESPHSVNSNMSSVRYRHQTTLFTTAMPNLPTKKKSPIKNLIRRIKYKASKELELKNLKIAQLKKQNEAIKKRLLRLQRQTCKNVTRASTSNVSSPVPTEATNRKSSLIGDIKNFFEDDEVSRMTSGKREFITKNKIKKQKRYLNDTLQNLYKTFSEKYPDHRISYSFFCKLRSSYAFWAISPSVNIRDTCLCQEHGNMDLAVVSLKKNKMINEKTTTDVIKALTCDAKNIDCLTKQCKNCTNKDVLYQEFNNTIKITYEKWAKTKSIYIKNGKEMNTTHTSKQTIECYPKDLINYFDKIKFSFLQHCANMIVQSGYIKKLKISLNNTECLIHCDYSENYNAKYATEVQSFHFGGSRRQISLHTVVIYFMKDGILQNQCFCTISESLRHDAVAVWSHLLPILRYIENTLPEVNSLYFLSDSPSAQYRNRKMFYIIAKLNWYFPKLCRVEWNYSEKGHGKGAPDGVGGTLKRTADKIVAQGHDIPDMETLLTHLKRNISGIILEVIHEYDMLEKEMLMPSNLKEFRGTLKVHQVVWCKNNPYVLAMRKLSCRVDNCLEEAVECAHGQHLGFFSIDDDFRTPSVENTRTTNKTINQFQNQSGKKKKQNQMKKPAIEFNNDDSFEILESPKLYCRSKYLLNKTRQSQREIEKPTVENRKKESYESPSTSKLCSSSFWSSFWEDVPSLENVITDSISNEVLSSLDIPPSTSAGKKTLPALLPREQEEVTATADEFFESDDDDL